MPPDPLCAPLPLVPPAPQLLLRVARLEEGLLTARKERRGGSGRPAAAVKGPPSGMNALGGPELALARSLHVAILVIIG